VITSVWGIAPSSAAEKALVAPPSILMVKAAGVACARIGTDGAHATSRTSESGRRTEFIDSLPKSGVLAESIKVVDDPIV
jgi:hypothetical protein